jgi:hypothetical protein
MELRVVCGLGETMEIFWPMRRLSKVDLPALVGPSMTTWPKREAFSKEGSEADGIFVAVHHY